MRAKDITMFLHWQKKNIHQPNNKSDNAVLFLLTSLFFCFSYIFAEQKEGGTQLKLIIDYGNNFEALFKPMRFNFSAIMMAICIFLA